MPSIREALEAAAAGLDPDAGGSSLDGGGAVALDAGSATAVETPPVETPPIERPADRLRDDGGRFAPRDAGAQARPRAGAVAAAADAVRGAAQGAPQAGEQPQATVPVQVDPRLATPPSSWKPEKRAKWEAVDPEVREYIHQREEEIARGVEPLKRVWGTLQPYMPLIQESGRSPEAVVGDVMHTVALLKTSDPQTKFDLWMNIGKAYGVPTQQLSAAAGQGEQSQVDPHVAQLTTQIQELRGAVGGFQQQQVQAVQSHAQQMIAEFGQSHPHLDKVGPTMGKLISMGEAPDLQTAYDKAIRLHDDLWQQQQAQQREADQRANREAADKAAKAARRSAVSTRSATPGAGAAGNANSNPTDRRALIAEQVSAMSTGRI